MQRRSTGEGPSPVIPEGKNEFVPIEIKVDDAEEPVADTGTAILESQLLKYYYICNARFKKYQIISSSAVVTSE